MSDKKHIDRLFQEKFKDFEAQPSAKVWENIQSQLEQPTPKQNKAIPLWAKVASIAALLLLFISIGSLLIDDSNGNNTDVPSVVDTNSKNGNTNTSDHNKDKDLDNNAPNTTVVDSKNTTETSGNSFEEKLNSSENEGVASNSNKKESNPSINNTATSTTTQKTSTTNTYNSKNATENNTNEAIANTKSASSSSSSNANNRPLNTKNRVNNSTQKGERIANTNKTLNKESEVVSTNNKQQANNTNAVVSNTNNYKNKASQTINATNNTNTSNTGISSNNTIENELNTTDATAIASVNSLNEKEKENITVDLDFVKSNAIEEAIAKNQDIIEKEKDVDRWSVNASIAPVYYNTLGKGSHIHDQFIDNPKNGELNTSYGIQVGYAFNDRLKVRSGISKLNLSYDTANVIVYENVTNTPGSNPLRNIDFIPNRDGQTLSVLSTDNLGIQQINDFANDKLNAALSQRIDYIEVPLELEYALVNKRFGVNVIGGVSTFILNDNEVVTEVDNRKTLIGKANNINNISFSTNFGIGIDYKFSDTFKFNLEPTFKYQINAFSETSGDFKPYIIGVYTGFSYKF